MMANVCCRVDKKDNIFPFKEGDENKIDGAVATITAMARAMYDEGIKSTPVPTFV
jgi:phage terminase large subunit-like protein